jgi:hypothetical protein
MLRTSLRGVTRRRIDEQVNPMESVINIVDAFMVCMVGVLAMLIVFYNVDLRGVQVDAVHDNAAESVSDISDEDIDADEAAGKYEKMGVVYVDSATGKMYVVSDEDADE